MIRRVFLLAIIPNLMGQDIVFPDNQKIADASGNRQTVKCPPNMMYVPEEEGCECERGTLYYSPVDECYVPYQRGPCPSGEHLILPKGEAIAKCTVNTCGNNGTVLYENTCVYLLTPGPPCSEGLAVIIDEETYQLSCRNVTTVVYQIITAPLRRCSPGSRRAANGKCRAIL